MATDGKAVAVCEHAGFELKRTKEGNHFVRCKNCGAEGTRETTIPRAMEGFDEVVIEARKKHDPFGWERQKRRRR